MWEKILASLVTAILEMLIRRAEKPDTGASAGRRDELASRIRERVSEYERRVRSDPNGVRGAGGPGEDRA